MGWWDKEMKKILDEEQIEILMYKRYVDDINIIVKDISKENGTENDKITMTKIKSIGNRIHESIQLEADFPSNHEDKKVPILDVKVWINKDNKVIHEYYSKPMSSKYVVHERSAMPLKTKRTILTQELLRIILRCSPLLQLNITNKHIEDFILRMQLSG